MVLREAFYPGGVQDMAPYFIVKSGLDTLGHALEQMDLPQREFVVDGFVTPGKMREQGADVHGTFRSEKIEQSRDILFIKTGSVHPGI